MAEDINNRFETQQPSPDQDPDYIEACLSKLQKNFEVNQVKIVNPFLLDLNTNLKKIKQPGDLDNFIEDYLNQEKEQLYQAEDFPSGLPEASWSFFKAWTKPIFHRQLEKVGMVVKEADEPVKLRKIKDQSEKVLFKPGVESVEANLEEIEKQLMVRLQLEAQSDTPKGKRAEKILKDYEAGKKDWVKAAVQTIVDSLEHRAEGDKPIKELINRQIETFINRLTYQA